MMYGASWIDRFAASSWISESGLSGRQISGGGSSPNSSRMTSARDVMSQHSMGVRILVGKRSANLLRPSSSVQCDHRLSDQGQTISKDDELATPIVHVLGLLAWVAVACQLGGGPGSSVATTVTSVVGLKPSEIPLPEK